MKTNKYTNEQIASDYKLWMEYVDPSGVDSEEQFNSMPLAERIAIVAAL